MEDRVWDELEALNRPLGLSLRKAFSKPALLSLAVTDEGESSDIVAEAVGAAKGSAENKRLGAALLTWATKHRRLEGRQVNVVVDSVYRHGAASSWYPQPGFGDHYDTLVRTSPELALDAFEKTLQAHKRGRLLKEGADDHEEKQKTEWALTLAAFIEEADLPAAARIRACEAPDKMWTRAFGNRRSKTLRGRALIWTKVRAWCVATYGHPWPKDVGQVLRYFEDRHDAQPMGKTVPDSVLSAITLLEQVGQVQPSARLSTDTLLVEAVKSWTGDLEQGVKPKKVAPMYTVATLLAAELLVCRKDLPIRLRFYGFVFLLMNWACLRCDEISRGALESGTISTPADLDHLLRCLAMDRW